MPSIFYYPFVRHLFDRCDPPSIKRSVIHQRTSEAERSNVTREPSLERMLPDSAEMKDKFLAWDRHARIALSWPVLEPFSSSRRDVEPTDGTAGGRSAFVWVND